MIKGWMIAIAILTTVAVSAPAMAYRDVRVGYGKGPGTVEDIAADRDLELTLDQKEKIGVLREAHLRDIKPLQEQLSVKSRELKELWLSSTPDREMILARQREVHSLRNQLMEKLTAYRLDTLQLLSPEQRARVRPFGPERRPPPMDGPGMREGRRHGPGMR
jgi:Spy/CpxP family protein refolding chaperone